MLAVVALVSGRQGADLPGLAVAFLLLAVILFLVAAVAGVVCNRPREYDEPTPGSLLRMVEEHWDAEQQLGARMVAKNRVAVYGCAQVRNGEKANALTWGTRAQVGGMVAVSVAVLCVLLS